ncbi:hypothetical protein D3C80_1397040 [compost metagenome]
MTQGLRWPQGDGIDECFAGQQARPYRGQPAHDVRLVGKELRNVVADLWHKTAQTLEGFAGSAVDCHQAHLSVGRKHVGQAAVDQLTEQFVVGLRDVLALGQQGFQFRDACLQLVVGGLSDWLHAVDPLNGSHNYSRATIPQPSK